jgi:alkylation response protein AidB-like acyl-CoA dehydrogenase
MHLQPSSGQRGLMALARRLAHERRAPRAERHGRDASFPLDAYVHLRADGFLGLCVPEVYAGLGADYETNYFVGELASGTQSSVICNRVAVGLR